MCHLEYIKKIKMSIEEIQRAAKMLYVYVTGNKNKK